MRLAKKKFLIFFYKKQLQKIEFFIYTIVISKKNPKINLIPSKRDN